MIVKLIQNDKAVPLAAGAKEIHGPFKGGVIVDDFDKTLEILKARGVEIAYGPYPRRGDFRSNVIIRDKAGNLIRFFAK